MKQQPTKDIYPVLQKAYDHFNRKIFGNKLPNCLITLSAELKSARGYYRNHPFEHSEHKDQVTDEIALNPFTFTGRTDREIYSTLVHEMVHLWQHHFGIKNTKTVHDTEWANKMEEIGLMPTSTGVPGGKRTGRKVTHYIIEGGTFDEAEKPFDVAIPWRGSLTNKEEKKKPRRTKYTCPECGLNAYGKPAIHLVCGKCDTSMLC